MSMAIRDLTSLTYLNLSTNSLKGKLSGEVVGSLGNLLVLDLGSNAFSSAAPAGVCVDGLKLAETLDFSYNNFSGEIGSGFGECLKLEVLRLGNNLLTGFIPDDVYSVTSLKELAR